MKVNIAILLLVILVGFSVTANATYFIGIGDLPGGNFHSEAYGVSADGSVVVGYSTTSGVNREAFKWTKTTGLVGLGQLPQGSVWTRAKDASADGSIIIGSCYTGKSTVAFYWAESTGYLGIGDLAGGDFYSEANRISANGTTIVGISSSSLGFQAFRWTISNGIVGLGDLPGGDFSSEAVGVSSNGSVIVGDSLSEIGREVFHWTQSDNMNGLGFRWNATNISADGSTIIGDGELGPFRWTESEGQIYLSTDGSSCYAWGISADGLTIVGQRFKDNAWEAFIWDNSNGIRNLKDVLTTQYGLELPDWTLTAAHAISDDGTTIVGQGINPFGYGEAFVAYTGPDDADDNCPYDPDKIDPGLCGCGISDIDSDVDGIPDCNDNGDNDIPVVNSTGGGGCFISLTTRNN